MHIIAAECDASFAAAIAGELIATGLNVAVCNTRFSAAVAMPILSAGFLLDSECAEKMLQVLGMGMEDGDGEGIGDGY